MLLEPAFLIIILKSPWLKKKKKKSIHFQLFSYNKYRKQLDWSPKTKRWAGKFMQAHPKDFSKRPHPVPVTLHPTPPTDEVWAGNRNMRPWTKMPFLLQRYLSIYEPNIMCAFLLLYYVQPRVLKGMQWCQIHFPVFKHISSVSLDRQME